MSKIRSVATKEKKAMRLLGVLAPVFVVSFGLAFTVTVDWQDGTLTVASAYAKGGSNGGGGGNGGGKGRDNAPGQAGQDIVSDNFGSADEAGDVEASISGDGREDVEAGVPEIVDETAPASILVIKELAGLPDNSALSEEEELEAIRSGWGTWRTADGPDTVMAQ